MEHSYFIDKLSAYLDGDLPDYEYMAVQEHLESCAECRAQLEKYRRLNDLIEEKSRLAEGDYWEESARKIEQAIAGPSEKVVEISPRKSIGMFWKIGAVAASAAILTFISLHRSEIEEPVKQKMSAPSKPAVIVPEAESLKSLDTALTTAREERSAEKPSAGTADETRTMKPEISSEKSSTARKDIVEFSDKLQKKVQEVATPDTTGLMQSVTVGKDEITDADEAARQEEDETEGGADNQSIKFSAPVPPALQSKTNALKAAQSGQLLTAGETESDITALKLRRDSLEVAVKRFTVARLKEDLLPVVDSVSDNAHEITYSMVIDSLISVVYRIGISSNDTADVIGSRDYLTNFPFTVTENQQKTIDRYLKELTGRAK